MNKLILAASAFLFWHGAAYAAKRVPGTSGPQLGCSITKLTPSETKTLSAKQLNQLVIVSQSYYTAPCWRATVDFLIAPIDPTFNSAYQDLYFDSISNELIDTKAKCNTYYQTTGLYMETNGVWKQKDFGRLRGSWSNGKCSFKPPAGQSDFRTKKYSPLSNQQAHYRLMSVVTTGKGIVLPAPPLPNIGQTYATARSVCFAVEHAHDDNTPVQGCADPTS